MAIQLNSVTKSFGTPPVYAVRDISLTINEHEWIAITGKSGSGKSTLLYLMSTLDPSTSGQVFIDGSDVMALGEDSLNRFRNHKMGFVFQFHYLIPELSVIENVLLPCRMEDDPHQFLESAKEWLAKFELTSKQDRFPSQLSGGEQQRAAIARALIRNPKYLFADEPTGNLDSQNGERVMSIFREINQVFGTTIVMVTHDPDFAAAASRTIELKDGRLESDHRSSKCSS